MQTTSTQQRTVIVTGANKGIGYSIVEGLLAGKTPYHIILTTRDLNNGQKAATELNKKHPQSASKVTVRQLDIADASSLNAFVDWTKSTLGTVDVLINNGAIGEFPEKSQQIKLDTLNINFFKTIELTEKLLPNLANDGKVIFLSSGLGALSNQPENAVRLLEDPTLTRERLFELANKLYKGIEQGTKDFEVSDNAYNSTKALINAYVRWVIAKQFKQGQQVYTVCPGWCRTDMGGQSATRSQEQGADSPVYLTNLPFEVNNKIQATFLRDREVISWN